jgi:hypothetical protein
MTAYKLTARYFWVLSRNKPGGSLRFFVIPGTSSSLILIFSHIPGLRWLVDSESFQIPAIQWFFDFDFDFFSNTWNW